MGCYSQLEERFGKSCAGLGSALNHHHSGTANVDHEILEIHICPLEFDKFSTSQAGEGVQFCRCSKGFWQFLE
jgi:hypothetical protein